MSELEENKFDDSNLEFEAEESEAELVEPPSNFKFSTKDDDIDYAGQNKVILCQLKEEEPPIERIITGKHFYKEM
jgi:hypothetical protein